MVSCRLYLGPQIAHAGQGVHSGCAARKADINWHIVQQLVAFLHLILPQLYFGMAQRRSNESLLPALHVLVK